jgi:signal transduction histidine kinase
LFENITVFNLKISDAALFVLIIGLFESSLLIYLSKKKKNKAILYIGIGILLDTLSYIPSLIGSNIKSILFISGEILVLPAVLLLIYGINKLTGTFSRNTMRLINILISLMVISSFLIGVKYNLVKVMIEYVSYVVYGILLIVFGLFLPKKQESSTLVSVSIIIWGLYTIIYVFLSSFINITPYSYLIEVILGKLLVYSIIVMLFLQERKNLEEATGRIIEYQEELRSENQNNAKLMVSLSHNIRNPLCAINSSLDLLKKMHPKDENSQNAEMNNLANIIGTNLEKIESYTNQIEDIVKLSTKSSKKNFQYVLLNDLTVKIRNLLSESFISTKLDEADYSNNKDIKVFCDEEKILLAFSSIILLFKSENIEKDKTRLRIDHQYNYVIMKLILPFSSNNNSETSYLNRITDNDIYSFVEDTVIMHNGSISFEDLNKKHVELRLIFKFLCLIK